MKGDAEWQAHREALFDAFNTEKIVRVRGPGGYTGKIETITGAGGGYKYRVWIVGTRGGYVEVLGEDLEIVVDRPSPGP